MHAIKTNHLGVEIWDFCTLDRSFEIEPDAGAPHSCAFFAQEWKHTDRTMGFAFHAAYARKERAKDKDLTSGRVNQSLTTPAVIECQC
jgi:hypothetical protein